MGVLGQTTCLKNDDFVKKGVLSRNKKTGNVISNEDFLLVLGVLGQTPCLEMNGKDTKIQKASKKETCKSKTQSVDRKGKNGNGEKSETVPPSSSQSNTKNKPESNKHKTQHTLLKS